MYGSAEPISWYSDSGRGIAGTDAGSGPTEAWRWGWARADKKVVLGDGAEWIWNQAERLPHSHASGQMTRGKIDLKKIQASLTTTCPKCGRVIQPSEIRRVNFEEMICPECGARFDAAKTKPGKQ